jgi:hypothetical protein
VLIAITACTHAPARRSPSARAVDGWRLVDPLGGVSVHAGIAVPGGALLAGETPDGGVLVRYAGSHEVLGRFPGVRTLRGIARDGDGILVAGEDEAARGFVARVTGPRVGRIPVPPAVTELDAVLADGPTLWAAGEAGANAVVIRSDDGGSAWRTIALLAGRRFARLTSLASTPDGVIAAGTDGRVGVLIRRGVAVRLPALSVASGVSVSRDGLVVAGYAGAADAERTAVLLRSAGIGWEPVRVPDAVAVTAIALERAAGAAVVATGVADAVIETADGGRSWRPVTLPGGAIPATLECTFAGSGALWAAGESGLYRRLL